MKLISNKTLFSIHGWLGLNVGLFLFVVCFSGTFATLSSEIDWLLNEDLRIEQKNDPIRWQAMYEAIQASYPGGTVTGIYKETYAGHGDHFATVAYVSLANGQNRKVYFDPYTGAIRGDTSFFNVQRFFRSYHRRLFDGDRGILLVTFSSFFLLFSALTGFLFYKGWLKNVFKLRIGRGIKALFSDAHKLAGIWSLLFTVLIAVTSIFYFAEIVLKSANNYDAFVPEEPAPMEKIEQVQFGPDPELLSLDTYVENAEKAFPGLEVMTVRVPHQTSDYVYIDGKAGNPITRHRANKVYLHPFTGEVMHVQRSAQLSVPELISDIADPLHFGYFGGMTTKILWFIFGLVLSFSILSGTYLWYVRGIEKMERRLKRKRSKAEAGATETEEKLTPAGVWLPYLTSSRGAILSTVIIVYYLGSTGIAVVNEGLRSYGPLPENRIASVQEVQLGPWSAELKCEYPCTVESSAFQLQFHGKGIPNYAALALEVEGTESTAALPFGGAARSPVLAAVENIEDGATEKVRLVATSHHGREFTAPVAKEHIREARMLLESRFDQYPDKAYPSVPADVYVVILLFAISTIAVIACWVYFLMKATSKKIALARVMRKE